MKALKMITLLLVIASCSEEQIQDDRLMSYAIEVKSQLAARGLDIDLEISLILKDGLFDEGAHGLSQGNTIYIDYGTYENIINADTPRLLEGLLAHEIGHNRLNLNHLDKSERDRSGMDPKIMIPGEWRWITEDNINAMYDNLVELARAKKRKVNS